MIFGYIPVDIQVKITIDNVDVKRAYEIKFLGVTLDHKSLEVTDAGRCLSRSTEIHNRL